MSARPLAALPSYRLWVEWPLVYRAPQRSHIDPPDGSSALRSGGTPMSDGHALPFRGAVATTTYSDALGASGVRMPVRQFRASRATPVEFGAAIADALRAVKSGQPHSSAAAEAMSTAAAALARVRSIELTSDLPVLRRHDAAPPPRRSSEEWLCVLSSPDRASVIAVADACSAAGLACVVAVGSSAADSGVLKSDPRVSQADNDCRPQMSVIDRDTLISAALTSARALVTPTAQLQPSDLPSDCGAPRKRPNLSEKAFGGSCGAASDAAASTILRALSTLTCAPRPRQSVDDGAFVAGASGDESLCEQISGWGSDAVGALLLIGAAGEVRPGGMAWVPRSALGSRAITDWTACEVRDVSFISGRGVATVAAPSTGGLRAEPVCVPLDCAVPDAAVAVAELRPGALASHRPLPPLAPWLAACIIAPLVDSMQRPVSLLRAMSDALAAVMSAPSQQPVALRALVAKAAALAVAAHSRVGHASPSLEAEVISRLERSFHNLQQEVNLTAQAGCVQSSASPVSAAASLPGTGSVTSDSCARWPRALARNTLRHCFVVQQREGGGAAQPVDGGPDLLPLLSTPWVVWSSAAASAKPPRDPSDRARPSNRPAMSDLLPDLCDMLCAGDADSFGPWASCARAALEAISHASTSGVDAQMQRAGRPIGSLPPPVQRSQYALDSPALPLELMELREMLQRGVDGPIGALSEGRRAYEAYRARLEQQTRLPNPADRRTNPADSQVRPPQTTVSAQVSLAAAAAAVVSATVAVSASSRAAIDSSRGSASNAVSGSVLPPVWSSPLSRHDGTGAVVTADSPVPGASAGGYTPSQPCFYFEVHVVADPGSFAVGDAERGQHRSTSDAAVTLLAGFWAPTPSTLPGSAAGGLTSAARWGRGSFAIGADLQPHRLRVGLGLMSRTETDGEKQPVAKPPVSTVFRSAWVDARWADAALPVRVPPTPSGDAAQPNTRDAGTRALVDAAGGPQVIPTCLRPRLVICNGAPVDAKDPICE